MRLALLVIVACLAASAARAAAFGVDGTSFVVESAPGQRLTSSDLVGATFEIADGAGGVTKVRIDAVAAAAERPGVLLHSFSLIDSVTGVATPLCDPDASGRRAGFPVRGRWDGRRFVADDGVWFLTSHLGFARQVRALGLRSVGSRPRRPAARRVLPSLPADGPRRL